MPKDGEEADEEADDNDATGTQPPRRIRILVIDQATLDGDGHRNDDVDGDAGMQ